MYDDERLFRKSQECRTRGHARKLILELTHNNIRQHSFSYRAISLWNGLPNDIVVADSLDSFKSKIDYYIENNIV